MKQLVIILISLPFSIFSQTFSGEITYQTKIIPKGDYQLTENQKVKNGQISKYKIMDGYYKNTYYKDEEKVYSYTYHEEDKRMYDDREGYDYITFRDSTKWSEEPYNHTVYKDSTKEILGYDCLIVRRATENYTATTYYNSTLQSDPESFKDHRIANWYETLKDTNGGLSMGSIYEYENFIQVTEVVEIKELKLSKEDFQLNPEKKIYASEQALDKFPEPIFESDFGDCYNKKMKQGKKGNFGPVIVSLLVSKDGQITRAKAINRNHPNSEIIITIIAECCISSQPPKRCRNCSSVLNIKGKRPS